jgi:hypothetical protein
VPLGARIYRREKQDLDVEGNSSEGSEGDAKLWAGETGDRLATCDLHVESSKSVQAPVAPAGAA